MWALSDRIIKFLYGWRVVLHCQRVLMWYLWQYLYLMMCKYNESTFVRTDHYCLLPCLYFWIDVGNFLEIIEFDPLVSIHIHTSFRMFANIVHVTYNCFASYTEFCWSKNTLNQSRLGTVSQIVKHWNLRAKPILSQ